jgi:hypothetical protein
VAGGEEVGADFVVAGFDVDGDEFADVVGGFDLGAEGGAVKGFAALGDFFAADSGMGHGLDLQFANRCRVGQRIATKS